MNTFSARIQVAFAFAAASVLLPGLAAAQSPDDFIKDAVKGNAAEVKLGHLAEQKGSTDQVRSFGRMLATDHSKGHDDALTVAHQINVDAKDEPSDEGQKFYDKASKLNGREFDAAFASYMVNDHQKDIKDYTAQANDKSSAPVAAYAAKNLPVLKKHLATAEQIQKQEQGK